MSVNTYPFRWSSTNLAESVESLTLLKEMFDAELERVVTPSDRDDFSKLEWTANGAPAAHRGAVLSRIYEWKDQFSDSHPIFISLRAGFVNSGGSSGYLAATVRVGKGVSNGVLMDVFNPTNAIPDYGSADAARTTLVDHFHMSRYMYGASNYVVPAGVADFHKGECGFYVAQTPRGYGGETSPFMFGFERATSPDGSYRPDGLITLSKNREGNSSNTPGVKCLVNLDVSSSLSSPRDGIPAVRACNYTTRNFHEGAVPVALTSNVSGQNVTPAVSQSSGAVGPVYPWTFTAPGLVPWRSKMFVTVPVGDYPGGDFESQLFGQSLMYRPVDPCMSGPSWSTANYVGHGFYGAALPVWGGGITAASSYLSGSGCLAVLLGAALKKGLTE